MNWLSICRRVRKEIGLSGTDTSPASVTGQTGEMLNVVNWVGSAWLAVQGRAKWEWQWENTTVTILAGAYFVAAAVSADRYEIDATYAGTWPLEYMPWDDFRVVYPAALITAGNPTHWTVRPDRAVAVNARPETDLVLTVERFVNPSAIGGDAESPLMPEHQHEAIVWRAVMFYAGHDEAKALHEHAKTEFERIMGEAAIDDLPDYELGPPLC